MLVPRYFSLMESAWEVSQPWAVTTNTTMTAISETLCHTHPHTPHSPPQTHHVHLKRKVAAPTWLPEGMAGMERENTLIQPHLKDKSSLPQRAGHLTVALCLQ